MEADLHNAIGYKILNVDKRFLKMLTTGSYFTNLPRE
jgi:hypothetical protein